MQSGQASSQGEESDRPVTQAGDGQVSNSSERALGRDRQLIPVRRGDLVTSIYIDGSIAFPNSRVAVFKTQGVPGV